MPTRRPGLLANRRTSRCSSRRLSIPNTWRSSASWSAWTWNIAGRRAAAIVWSTTAAGSPSYFRNVGGCRRSPSKSSACAGRPARIPLPWSTVAASAPIRSTGHPRCWNRWRVVGPGNMNQLSTTCLRRAVKLRETWRRPRRPTANTTKGRAAIKPASTPRSPREGWRRDRPSCSGTSAGLIPARRTAWRGPLPVCREWGARFWASGSNPSWGAGRSAASSWRARVTSPIGPWL